MNNPVQNMCVGDEFLSGKILLRFDLFHTFAPVNSTEDGFYTLTYRLVLLLIMVLYLVFIPHGRVLMFFLTHGLKFPRISSIN